MNPADTESPTAPSSWPAGNFSRIPAWAYTDKDVYQKELDRFFYGPHWSYVGLEAEIPEAGSFKRTKIGERSVIMVRHRSGAVHVLENRCAHRGMRFCQERHGKARSFTCPYHQWTYNLEGKLLGVPFRNGVKGKGGMDKDFQLEDHGLSKLKVAVRNGVVFASFSEDVPSFEDYVGPTVLPWFDRTFDGRKLVLHGYSRQRIPGNWKLMLENIKDPYHPGLLHTWFVTFGLWRADQQSTLLMDDHGRHACMISQRNEGGKADVTEGVTSFRENMKLNDPSLLDIVPEPWWGGPTVCMITLFPSVILQQQVNCLSTRQIIPCGPDAFDFVWTHFGFEEDTPEMHERRLKLANLFGPGGFVSADDGEVVEMSQDGFHHDPAFTTVCELDGTKIGNTDHNVSETLIRGMYRYWREVMEL